MQAVNPREKLASSAQKLRSSSEARDLVFRKKGGLFAAAPRDAARSAFNARGWAIICTSLLGPNCPGFAEDVCSCFLGTGGSGAKWCMFLGRMLTP